MRVWFTEDTWEAKLQFSTTPSDGGFPILLTPNHRTDCQLMDLMSTRAKYLPTLSFFHQQERIFP